MKQKNGKQAFFQMILHYHELVKFQIVFYLKTVQSWVQINKIISSQKIVNTDYLRCLIPSLVSNSKKIPENLQFGFSVVDNTTANKILTRTRRRGKSATKFLVHVAMFISSFLCKVLTERPLKGR